MSPKLVHRVEPIYPPLARAAHLCGTVVLHAIINREGTVQELQLVSGQPLLVQSSLDAVREWRYKPTLLNGQPVEVETSISVVYTMDECSEPAAPASIDSPLRSDILRMFEVMHMKENAAQTGRAIFQSLRPALLATLPPTPNRDHIVDAYSEKLLALLQSPDFVGRVVAIYAKYFTDDEIKALTQFYETPAGQHFYAVAPQLVGELNGIGQQLALENLADIFKQLCKEYPELQGEAKFCPNGDPQKKSLLLEPNPLPAGDRFSAAAQE